MAGGQAPPDPRPSDLVRIEFDMMLKGSVYRRRSGNVRQFGVTVGGATRLVTSGDWVDRATYEALLAVRAIRHITPPKKPDVPPQQDAPPPEAPEMRVAPPAKPAETPRQPSPPTPKPQQPAPAPIAPEPAKTEAVPESKPGAQEAPKTAAPVQPPPTETPSEDPSPKVPPDSPAPTKIDAPKQAPGPRGRVGKSRRRRGSR